MLISACLCYVLLILQSSRNMIFLLAGSVTVRLPTLGTVSTVFTIISILFISSSLLPPGYSPSPHPLLTLTTLPPVNTENPKRKWRVMRVFNTQFPDSAIRQGRMPEKFEKFNIKVAATQHSESNIWLGFLTTKYLPSITRPVQYIAEILSFLLDGFMISKISK